VPTRLRPTAPIAADAILVGDPGRALLLAQELLEQPKMSNHARGLWGYSGATPDGGVNRQTLTDDDQRGRDLFRRWCEEAGLHVSVDRMGSMFARRRGTDDDVPPVMLGSHLDSQPTGGRFDGMYGVLAAFEALEALEDAGVRTRRPVMAVAWTNEEGSRFQPGAMGSAVFAGRNRLDEMLEVTDWKGVMLKDALAETLKAAPAPMRDGPPGFPLDHYVEAHIEQGPRLESEKKTIGVVTGAQGQRWYEINWTGMESHAGTTPMEGRRDALVGGLRAHGHRSAHALKAPEGLAEFVAKHAAAGDIVVCLGAGTISAWANALPGELAALGD